MKNILLTILFAIVSTLIYGQGSPSPVAHYSFNDGTGTDQVGSNHATLVGGVNSIEDRFNNVGHAMHLDGSLGSYINLGAGGALKPSKGTISMWVYIDDVSTVGNGFAYNPIILAKNPNSPGSYMEAYCLYFTMINDRLLAITTGTSPTNEKHIFSGNGTLKLQQWHHIALTYGDASLTIYIDGVAAGSSLKGFTTTFSNEPVIVGNSLNAKNNRTMKGGVDDIKIYDTVLSPSQINDLYNEPNPSPDLPPVNDGIVPCQAEWDLSNPTNSSIVIDEDGVIEKINYGGNGRIESTHTLAAGETGWMEFEVSDFGYKHNGKVGNIKIGADIAGESYQFTIAQNKKKHWKTKGGKPNQTYLANFEEGAVIRIKRIDDRLVLEQRIAGQQETVALITNIPAAPTTFYMKLDGLGARMAKTKMSFNLGCPVLTFNITQPCNGSSATIDYSYSGIFGMSWKINGGIEYMTSGSGTLNDASPGIYEVYLVLPEAKYPYGPYVYEVKDIAPVVSLTQTTDCNATGGHGIITAIVDDFKPGQSYTATLKDEDGVELQSASVNSNSFTFGGVGAGSYTVEIQRSGQTCVTTETIVLGEGVFPLNVSAQVATCNGGSIDVNIPDFQSGETYSVLIKETASNQTVVYQQTTKDYNYNNLNAGTYEITVQHGHCTKTTQVVIESVDIGVVITYGSDGDGGDCYWDLDAGINNALPVSYNWELRNGTTTLSSGGISPTEKVNKVYFSLNATSAKVTITATDGCTYVHEVDLPSTELFPNVLPINTVTNNLCGKTVGEIKVDWFNTGLNSYYTIVNVSIEEQVSGVWGASQYIQPNGATDVTFKNLGTGKYRINFETLYNCHTDIDLPYEVDVLEDPFTEITGITQGYCPENPFGEIVLTNPTGTSNYSYEWYYEPNTNGIVGPNLSTLHMANPNTTSVGVIGDYRVSVTELSSGCTAEKIFTISNFEFNISSLTSSDAICNQGGTITIAFSDNSLQYGDFPYTVALHDAGAPSPLFSKTGTVSSVVVFNSLSSGNYDIVLTSSSGCTTTLPIGVGNKGLDVSLAGVNPTSCVLPNGSVTATVALLPSDGPAGVLPYTYAWTDATNSTIGNSSTVNSLGQGVYTVVVSDASTPACTGTATIDLTETILNISASATWTGEQCGGGPHGSIDVTFSNPAPIAPVDGFLYVWLNTVTGVTTTTTVPQLTGQEPGDYVVSVKDIDECQYTQNVTIEAMPTSVSLPLVKVSRCGQVGFEWDGYSSFNDCSELEFRVYFNHENGGLPVLYSQFTESNSPGNHSYYYSNNLLEETGLIGIFPRIYFRPCCSSTWVNLGTLIMDEELVTGGMISNAILTSATCSSLGSADLTLAGNSSTATYDCVWPDGFIGTQRNDLEAGTYLVTIISSDGCEKGETIVIPGPMESPHLINTAACDGIIDIDQSNIAGGITPYSLTWSYVGNGTPSSIPDVPGQYTINIIDAEGCTSEEVLTIGSSEFTVIANIAPPTCLNNDGQISLTVNNSSNSVVSYSWTGPSSTSYEGQTINELEAGAYNYTVTAANGCIKEGREIMPVHTPINATFAGGCLPEVSSLTGGVAPYTLFFSAQNPDPLQASYSLILDENTTYPYYLNELDEGNYAVVVTDANGCEFLYNTLNTLNSTAPRTWDIKVKWQRQDQAEFRVKNNYDEAQAIKGDLLKQINDFLNDLNDLNDLGNFCEKQGSDELTVGYEQSLHHYTLYYYNIKDELVRTVPPAGVTYMGGTDLEALLDYRKDDSPLAAVPTTLLPNHDMVTQYDYNALGQMVRTISPDKGEMRSWYTSDGLLRFTQDARQASKGFYNYTLYDELFRVIEVGEMDYGTTTQEPALSQINDLGVLPGIRKEWTKTVYSEPHVVSTSHVAYYGNSGEEQEFLRNRVSFIENHQGVTTTYSYDAHGNVKWIRQFIPGMGENYIGYDYDLITNVVRKVRYNEFSDDRFFHRYEYDEQKRIKKVFTSTDGIIWDRDAEYDFYAHGPLKRTELGDDRIQGLDYVYTIQGWIKSVNHPLMHQYGVNANQSNDPGQDGFNGEPVMKDAFGYALGYFEGDYMRGTLPSVIDYTNGTRSLYNGNISAWSNGVNHEALENASPGFSSINENFSQRNFTYDELNRIKTSSLLTTLTPTSSTGTSLLPTMDPPGINNAYGTSYSYDGNGNLKGLNRSGKDAIGLIDDLTYNYGAGDLQNRLEAVTDIVGDKGVGDLSMTQVYTYDEIGNIKTITKENGIGNVLETIDITWRSDGKVSQVDIVDNVTAITSHINFIYDVLGNRVAKVFDPNTSIVDDEETTYHVLDATGNILATYKETFDGVAMQIELKSRTIFGSARLGNNTKSVILAGQLDIIRNELPNPNGLVIKLLDDKVFELSDHLGNVTMTLSDQKTKVGLGYEAQILSYQQYYPFGWEMPGRKFNTGDYRFGFNGKENDRHEWGSQLIQDYGFRLYNPAIGKFLSVDPLAPDYPWNSVYAFAEGDVIRSIDLDGLEKEFMYDAQNLGYDAAVKIHSSDVVSGVAQGVTNGVVGLYTFATRDAWKSSTWIGMALYFEEGILSSGNTSVYRPNTPILDAQVQDFEDRVINGDAFSRSEYLGEAAFNAVVSKGSSSFFKVDMPSKVLKGAQKRGYLLPSTPNAPGSTLNSGFGLPYFLNPSYIKELAKINADFSKQILDVKTTKASLLVAKTQELTAHVKLALNNHKGKGTKRNRDLRKAFRDAQVKTQAAQQAADDAINDGNYQLSESLKEGLKERFKGS